MRIEYTEGDATGPIAAGNKIIVHICNDIGALGKGFVMAISKKWKEPVKQYKAWDKSKDGFELGEVQFVQVEDDIWIANMIGQHRVYKDEVGNSPIGYEAVRSALEKVAIHALQHDASVHMPRIGCGLAGGTWDKIEPILVECLVSKGVWMTVSTSCWLDSVPAALTGCFFQNYIQKEQHRSNKPTV